MPKRPALARVDIGMGRKPALIVVDLIIGLTDPSSPLGSDADSVVEANLSLMESFHTANLPVVLTTVIYRNRGQAALFRTKVQALNWLKPNSALVKFDPRLPIISNDFRLEKRHSSAFHGPN